MPATTPAKSTITRVWDYAEETGQDVRDVYVKLLTVIGIDNPEAVDAAFAEMRAHSALEDAADADAVRAARADPGPCIPWEQVKAESDRLPRLPCGYKSRSGMAAGTQVRLGGCMTTFVSIRPPGCRCTDSASGPGLICQACRRRWAHRARAQKRIEQAYPLWKTWEGTDRQCHALRREGAALQVSGEDWLALLAEIRAAEAHLEDSRPAAWRPPVRGFRL